MFLTLITSVAAGAVFVAVPAFFIVRSLVRAEADKRSLAESALASATEKLNFKEQKISELAALNTELKGSVETYIKENAILRDSAAQLPLKNEQIFKLEEALSALEARIAEMNDNSASIKAENAALNTALNAEKTQAAEKLAVLDDARKNLLEVLKNTASELFEEKSRKFNELNKESVESLMKPLHERLKDFSDKLEESRRDSARDAASLRSEMKILNESSVKIGQDAVKLANALKSQNKSQGIWGEMLLDSILEAAGLRKGIEFTAQESLDSNDGKRLIPDVVLNLPGDRKLVIDSKVSLTAYARYAEAPESEIGLTALAEHVQSVKKHINELSAKKYHSHVSGSPDFVFMFIPLESAFSSALNESPEIFSDALKKNVAVVTPATLLTSAKIVDYIWKIEKQNRNSKEIAKIGGELYDRFNDLIDKLIILGTRIRQSSESYDEVMKKMKSGRGNLIEKASRIRELGGAASTQIRTDLLSEALDFKDEDDSVQA